MLLLALPTGSDDEGGRSAEGSEAAASRPALPQGDEPFEPDPDDLVDRIDNPYWPMVPGSRWVYREVDAVGDELRVVVTVTKKTRVVADIDATVVHDVATENGAVIEDTYDWYA